MLFVADAHGHASRGNIGGQRVRGHQCGVRAPPCPAPPCPVRTDDEPTLGASPLLHLPEESSRWAPEGAALPRGEKSAFEKQKSKQVSQLWTFLPLGPGSKV